MYILSNTDDEKLWHEFLFYMAACGDCVACMGNMYEIRDSDSSSSYMGKKNLFADGYDGRYSICVRGRVYHQRIYGKSTGESGLCDCARSANESRWSQPRAQMRLDTAYDYLVSNPNTQVIVSGGQGADEHVSEAQGMYDYLVGRGIAPERIILENRSRNTSQNINFSSVFLDKESHSVGIVSNNFHIFRATHIAKKSGYQQVYGIPAPAELSMQGNNMLREFFGVVKDFLVGNI